MQKKFALQNSETATNLKDFITSVIYATILDGAKEILSRILAAK